MSSKHLGPGLAKSKRAPIIERKGRNFVRSTDYPWRELFERADIVSEGALRDDSDGRSYYGSTHIRFTKQRVAEVASDIDLPKLRWLLHSCPHARIRAIRVACLEAQIRAGAPLFGVRTDVTFSNESDVLELSVDIDGRLACAKCAHQTAAHARPSGV